MNGKLNLSIDDKLKDKIKSYAAVRHLSLSVLVENYFKSLLSAEEANILSTPLTDSLVGILNDSGDIDINSIRLKHLEDKYLNA